MQDVVCSVLRQLPLLWGPLVGCTFPFTSDTLLFQLLAKLLKSKNPDDLQEANKLIKSMVKEVSGPWALGRGGQSGSPFPWVGLLFAPATSPRLQRPENGLEEQEWMGPV